MFIACMVAYQDSMAILRKYEKGVYAVRADDKVASGFAVGDGKFLVTCDHVIGFDSKITILNPKSDSHFGYLVFHDSKLDIAVYRMDRVSPVSLKINTDTIVAGRPVFVPGISLDKGERQFYRGSILGVAREGDRANVRFDGDIPVAFSGSPLLNAKGEVVGMAQASVSAGTRLSEGISGYSLSKYLRDQTLPPEAPVVVGNLGQVLDTTRVCESADLDSRTIFTASPLQYLLVNDFSEEFLKVTLPNGNSGYIRTSMVKIIVPNVTTGSPGVVNGFEVNRVIKAFDTSMLREASSTAEWQKETLRFVGMVFATAGREISDDLGVQLDIGRPVESSADLQIGDRIYFGTGKSGWAAIYVGDDSYTTVSRVGKLVTAKFSGAPTKPFYRALH